MRLYILLIFSINFSEREQNGVPEKKRSQDTKSENKFRSLLHPLELYGLTSWKLKYSSSVKEEALQSF